MQLRLQMLYKILHNVVSGGLRDKMLRDRIVIRIRDFGLSKHLQIDANFTLDTAKRAVRQK